MNRRDRARWRSAESLADLGELVVAWLNGEIKQTPGHLGPPCDETIPLIPVLTAVNRAGFVTDNSQLAETVSGGAWEAWVCGFVPGGAHFGLSDAIALASQNLVMTSCRHSQHECGKTTPWGFCPGEEARGFWRRACPLAADELGDAWWVQIGDPEPGRNDRLWPALERFAR